MSQPHEFSVDVGLIVFSRDGHAQFGWHDRATGAFYAEANGRCIPTRSEQSSSTRT